MARRQALVGATALDLRLQYEPIAAIDRARFHLWTQQAHVDASAAYLAARRTDVTTLEWVRDRSAHTIELSGRARLDTRLEQRRANVTDREPTPPPNPQPPCARPLPRPLEDRRSE